MNELLKVMTLVPKVISQVAGLSIDTLDFYFEKIGTVLEKTGKFVKEILIYKINDLPEKGKLTNTKFMLEDLSDVLGSTLRAVIQLNSIFAEMKKDKDAWDDTDETSLKKKQKDFKARFESKVP